MDTESLELSALVKEQYIEPLQVCYTFSITGNNCLTLNQKFDENIAKFKEMVEQTIDLDQLASHQ